MQKFQEITIIISNQPSERHTIDHNKENYHYRRFEI